MHFGIPQSAIQEDNQGTIALATNPQFHQRSKHFNPKLYYIHEKIAEGAIDISICATGEMRADVLTKPLPKPAHEVHVKSLGMAWHPLLSSCLHLCLVFPRSCCTFSGPSSSSTQILSFLGGHAT